MGAPSNLAHANSGVPVHIKPNNDIFPTHETQDLQTQHTQHTSMLPCLRKSGHSSRKPTVGFLLSRKPIGHPRSDTEVTVGERPPSLSHIVNSAKQRAMDTSIVFNPRIHPPICLSRMSDVTVPPWISAFGSSLTLGPSVAPKLDHHSHGIQNNMSQQRTCHVHDHMQLSHHMSFFTTTCHCRKRQHVSPSNNNRLVS